MHRAVPSACVAIDEDELLESVRAVYERESLLTL